MSSRDEVQGETIAPFNDAVHEHLSVWSRRAGQHSETLLEFLRLPDLIAKVIEGSKLRATVFRTFAGVIFGLLNDEDDLRLVVNVDGVSADVAGPPTIAFRASASLPVERDKAVPVNQTPGRRPEAFRGLRSCRISLRSFSNVASLATSCLQ
jgi:hypothetical protein